MLQICFSICNHIIVQKMGIFFRNICYSNLYTRINSGFFLTASISTVTVRFSLCFPPLKNLCDCLQTFRVKKIYFNQKNIFKFMWVKIYSNSCGFTIFLLKNIYIQQIVDYCSFLCEIVLWIVPWQYTTCLLASYMCNCWCIVFKLNHTLACMIILMSNLYMLFVIYSTMHEYSW
jgi:hypothetical protein